MANSRIARFFMEVAPPQYVTVMRHRTSKMLDTITEDEREISTIDSVISPPKWSTAVAVSASSTSAASVTNAKGRYFLKEVHRSLSILKHRHILQLIAAAAATT
ncbi:hypothetical protein VNO78_11155 [Psophocarpus tetragonolobus]|uniref:Uncharacterized protein n=1 Tax=Psophocarpus tetragonolobus TaxID=3891 RepID=A0AAN9SL88_PSOTE